MALADFGDAAQKSEHTRRSSSVGGSISGAIPNLDRAVRMARKQTPPNLYTECGADTHIQDLLDAVGACPPFSQQVENEAMAGRILSHQRSLASLLDTVERLATLKVGTAAREKRKKSPPGGTAAEKVPTVRGCVRALAQAANLPAKAVNAFVS